MRPTAVAAAVAVVLVVGGACSERGTPLLADGQPAPPAPDVLEKAVGGSVILARDLDPDHPAVESCIGHEGVDPDEVRGSGHVVPGAVTVTVLSRGVLYSCQGGVMEAGGVRWCGGGSVVVGEGQDRSWEWVPLAMSGLNVSCETEGHALVSLWAVPEADTSWVVVDADTAGASAPVAYAVLDDRPVRLNVTNASTADGTVPVIYVTAEGEVMHVDVITRVDD